VALLAPADFGRAEAAFDVGGAVVATSPRLDVRVEITNRGDRLAAPLDVVGELAGERREARLEAGIAPGERGSVVLDFAAEGARPGLHALTLMLEHPQEGPPDAASNPPVASHLAWLVVALGSNPGPAVRLVPGPLRIDTRGRLAVRVESEDGAPHRVRLRAVTTRGIRAEGEGPEVPVPGAGGTTAEIELVRTGAPHGSRHVILIAAEALDSALSRTAIAAATVEVVDDAAWLPRLRLPLIALAVVLLAVAGLAEWRRFRPR
jgi:hypothetical protein